MRSDVLDAPSDVYLLRETGVQTLTGDTPESELYPVINPDAARVAFVEIAPTGERSIVVTDTETGTKTTLFVPTADLSVGLYAPAWSADGSMVFATLVNATGETAIYLMQVGEPLEGNPCVPSVPCLITEGAAPFLTPDGQFMAYTLGSNVMIMLVESGLSQPITEQPEGSICETPSFDRDGLTLYFVCIDSNTSLVFRYDLDGLSEVLLSGEDGQSRTFTEAGSGQTFGLVTLGDNSTFQTVTDPVLAENATIALPVVQIAGLNTRHLRWYLSPPEVSALMP
ncbi:MAG: hypothetical protein H7175_10790 [Burkholderiales bacterium]|nr:hypothetical protein [Anaerolineae bacterium]